MLKIKRTKDRVMLPQRDKPNRLLVAGAAILTLVALAAWLWHRAGTNNAATGWSGVGQHGFLADHSGHNEQSLRYIGSQVA